MVFVEKINILNNVVNSHANNTSKIQIQSNPSLFTVLLVLFEEFNGRSLQDFFDFF
jgi:hypothetical protein